MKKLLGVLFLLLIIYVIYFDLTVGTLPRATTEEAKAVQSSNHAHPYFESTVKPGDTIMTIVEHRLNDPLPVSIKQLVKDFHTLNPEQNSDQIQIGKTYKFPDYTQ